MQEIDTLLQSNPQLSVFLSYNYERNEGLYACTAVLTFRWSILVLKRSVLFRSSGADTHRARGAINAVHFSHGAVPLRLVGELNKAIALGAAGGGVSDNFSPFDRRIMGPESFLEEEVGDVGGEIADEDGMVGPRVSERGPIKPEGLFRTGHLGAVVGAEKGLRRRVRNELHEAVALRLARHLVANDFDGNHFATVGEALREVRLLHPVLQIANPKSSHFLDRRRRHLPPSRR